MTTPQKLPSGNYRVRYTDADGRRRSRTLPSLRAARKFDAEVQVKLNERRWLAPEPGQQTLAEWAEKWFRYNTSRRRTTRSWEETVYRTKVLPRWGDVRMCDITRDAVRAWVADLTDPAKYQRLRRDPSSEGRRPEFIADGGPLSARTVAQTYAMFSKIVRAAVEDRIIENPLPTRVGLPTAGRKRERFLNDGEVEQLADSINPIYRPLVLVCCYGGLRIGEAAALRVGDVDWERRQVRVTQTQTDVGGVIMYASTKTEAGRRTVPLPDQAIDALRVHVEKWLGIEAVSAFVFFSPTGKELRVRDWRRREFYPAVAAAGLERLTPHDMRHTAAAILISTGANRWELADILGHRDTRMIDRVYGHLFHEDRERLQRRLTRRVAGDGEPL